MRAAIITHYYNSENYGGLLQSYALTHVLVSLGVEAQQLSYNRAHEYKNNKGKKGYFLGALKSSARRIYIGSRFLLPRLKHPGISKNLNKRSLAIAKFRENIIPHSEKIYDAGTVAESNGEYDIFITGSDQVWHPQAVCGAYLLSFAGDNKRKFSYAASIASNSLPKKLAENFKKELGSYSGISVREENAVEILRELCPYHIECSLDPVLLLTRDEWDEILPESKVKGEYIFCYFLGDGVLARQAAEKFAKDKKLKLVNLAHMGGYKKCDDGFGDSQLYDVSPADFVCLIKNAQYIFTDSFHASAFSSLYNKQYFVFAREGTKTIDMSSRIYTLTKLFNSSSHYCDSDEKMTAEYIDGLEKINYTVSTGEFEKRKKQSIEYIKKNIDFAREER